jgi:hypothetical protein
MGVCVLPFSCALSIVFLTTNSKEVTMEGSCVVFKLLQTFPLAVLPFVLRQEAVSLSVCALLN